MAGAPARGSLHLTVGPITVAITRLPLADTTTPELSEIEHLPDTGGMARRLDGYNTPVEPNTRRLIRNEAWPRFPENFADREPIDVEAHIWWAYHWPPEWLPARADRWNAGYVRIVLTPAVRVRDRLVTTERRTWRTRTSHRRSVIRP